MNRVSLEIAGLSSSGAQSGHYALVLGETDGNRRLPVIIGAAEAQAIALELESIKTNRPMTHDLIYNIATHFDIQLQEVVINDLREGIFFARLVFEFEGQTYEIDSRTSDAVAIAVRFKVPIYAVENVMDEAGIVIEDEEPNPYADEEGEFSLAELETSESEPQEPSEGISEQSLEKLNQLLEEALSREDYEKAARLRDEISKKQRN